MAESVMEEPLTLTFVNPKRLCPSHGLHEQWFQLTFADEQSPPYYCVRCVRDLLVREGIGQVKE